MPDDKKGKLHFWDAVWPLDEQQCPCDIHLCQWIAETNIRNASIFHFGTGTHHVVGIAAGEDGRGNCVQAITASPGEYDSFVKLAIERPEIEKVYKTFFGDIYQLEERLLPEFDVVSLFHLCEFRNERNDLYGALTDLEVTEMLTRKTRKGGYILFYTKSFAFDTAERTVVETWEKTAPVERVGLFKTLLVYRKTG